MKWDLEKYNLFSSVQHKNKKNSFKILTNAKIKIKRIKLLIIKMKGTFIKGEEKHSYKKIMIFLIVNHSILQTRIQISQVNETHK